MRPPKRSQPDEWGAENRVYPSGSGHPGPRNPWLTPYLIPFERTVAQRRFRKVVLIMAAQSGKTEGLLDIIGHRFSERPASTLYVGPNRQFLTDQFEPRLMQMLDTAPTIRDKVARGKRMKKTLKIVAGNVLRLGHAGSPTALKSDPIALAITDELEDMLLDVKGRGNPVGLIDLRGENFADFVHVITSTPGMGPAETEIEEPSGLDFWKVVDPETVQSVPWRIWQTGTRHHWSWRCQGCHRYFIPRFSCLEWPERIEEVDEDGVVTNRKPTVEEVRRLAFLRCPNSACRRPIGSSEKAQMNASGVFVAPGQTVDEHGNVEGEGPDSNIASFWVSGLASPFRSFGDRAAEYVLAARSRSPSDLKAVVNGSLGELFSPSGGEVPAWAEVRRLSLPYKLRELPDGVRLLTAGVDVQKNRLVLVVRGWGVRLESWLIDYQELYGSTAEDDVWLELADYLRDPICGLHIRHAFIDSGYRPKKEFAIPEHKVYAFCRQYSRIAHACKGFENRDRPLSIKKFEVNAEGKAAQYGLELVRVDSDFFKSWVHERIRWPSDQPGAWHISADATDDYCRQIVSEARGRKASGGFTWFRLSKENHALDCESLAYAAAYMVGAQRIQEIKRPEAKGAAAPGMPKRKLSDIGGPALR